MKDNELQQKVLDWYRARRRDLPWRRSADPYRIWISEVMLQQTQVDTVIPYYERFIEQFPGVESLAKADLSAVLKAWEGLGYYARARNLHRAAAVIVREFDGFIPKDYQTLKTLPGIGEYTAAAIASIAFGQPVAVLDGNARRVLARWIGFTEEARSREGKRTLKIAADRFLYGSDAGAWNSAMMELGAMVCTPQNPRCDACPACLGCQAHRLGATDRIPLRTPRKPIPHYHVTAGLIWDKDSLLIAQRKEEGFLGGLWEFPGGKQEDGESLTECLSRELTEELNIRVEVGEEVCQVEHAYTHFSITLHVFQCEYLSGPPQALGCTRWKWVNPAKLSEFAFPHADRTVIEKLLQGTRS